MSQPTPRIATPPRRAAHSLAALFDAAPHGYLVLDPGLVIVEVNQQYLDMTMRDRADLIGRHLFDAFPDNPDDASADGTRNLRLSLETVLETRRPHAMAVQKYDIPRPPEAGGGFEERYWKPLNSPRLEDGEVVAIFHHVEDVTSEMLHRRDEAIRLRLAARIGNTAFWEYDPATRTLNVSSAFAVAFGFPPEEGTVPLERYQERLHEEDVEAVEAAFAEAADAPDHTVVDVSHRVILPSGEVRWLSRRGEVVRDHRNAPARFVGVAIDITGAKERERALQDALLERERLLEQKDVLLREVNHRIKNSLSLVTSILRLESTEAAGTAAEEPLRDAAARVQAIASIHELLYKSDRVQTVTFGRYLRDLCEALATSQGTGARGIAVRCRSSDIELPTDLAITLALLVNELVKNLLDHAFEGRSEGTIEVQQALCDGILTLTISHDGSGRCEAQGGAKLGARLVSGLVGQAKGEIEELTQSHGHAVRIRIPLG